MHWIITGFVALVMLPCLDAHEPPLVEKYLHSGKLIEGEQVLEAALAKAPQDDQVRFGLGFLRIVRAVERLGQSLHEYGAKPGMPWGMVIQIPVPNNPDPAPISDRMMRRMLDDFSKDLAAAEATLSGIADDQVKLPIRMAKVRVDLTGTGEAKDTLTDIVKGMMGRVPDIFKDNPDLLICFDRGDVAWFRAYCHLLMAMTDFYLAFDTEPEFHIYAKDYFAKVKPKLSDRELEAMRNKTWQEQLVFGIQEPLRLSRFRHHMIQVCKLNRETWRFIRAETDDDHEWLPNPKQKGVLGLPVRDEMIDAWLAMVNEWEAVLEGKKVISLNWGNEKSGMGLNLKKLLEEPPAKLEVFDVISGQSKYMENGTFMDVAVIRNTFQVFNRPLMMGYMAWFN